MNGSSDSQGGRTAQMIDGAERVREPEFRTMQQVGFGYRKTSVLDNLQPSGNGMSGLDKQRQMFGIRSLGQGEETADKSMWLKNPSNPSLYNTNLSFG